jgi:cytochrome bd-type quinol oxidase subunit 2
VDITLTRNRLLSPRRALWISSATVCIIVGFVNLLPLFAEVSSGISGQHLWTLETVWYAVIPVAAIVTAWLLARAVRRAQSMRAAIVLTVLSIGVVIGGCSPAIFLAYSLLFKQFRPAP